MMDVCNTRVSIEGEFLSGGHLRWNLAWPTPNYAGGEFAPTHDANGNLEPKWGHALPFTFLQSNRGKTR